MRESLVTPVRGAWRRVAGAGWTLVETPVAAGLACRPITDTIRDTLAWDLGRGGPEKDGLSPAEEERLLAELAGPAD